MPSFDARSASDLWDVVHFVMTLRKGGAEEIR
jgi:hypothetical protein